MQVEQVLIGETGEASLDNRSNDIVQVQFFDSIPFIKAGSHARPIGTKVVIRSLTFFLCHYPVRIIRSILCLIFIKYVIFLDGAQLDVGFDTS